jgi:hypothetical protein
MKAIGLCEMIETAEKIKVCILLGDMCNHLKGVALEEIGDIKPASTFSLVVGKIARPPQTYLSSFP